MKIQDFDTLFESVRPEEVEAALSRRHADGINSFWLWHGDDAYPAINISVKGDIAHVHYFPGGDHPGFASIEDLPRPSPDETTELFLSQNEGIWVPNDRLVQFSLASKAAQQFSVSTEKPKCIDWYSLVVGE